MRFAKYIERNTHGAYKKYYINYRALCGHILLQCKSTFAGEFLKSFNVTFNFMSHKYSDFELQLAGIEEMLKRNNGKAKTELTMLLNEMYNFVEFIRVNIEGFKRVAQKYERKAGHPLPSTYLKMVEQKRKSMQDINRLIYAASRLKLKLSHLKDRKENRCAFVRKTSKYWVHDANVMALKARIARHLRVYVFKAEGATGTPYCVWDYDLHDTSVSSVYLDNVDFDLYTGRIERSQGAEAIRIRWYGVQDPEIVFVKRKLHEESWTGERSKKLRFRMHEKDVLEYINGKDVWLRTQELNEKDSRALYKEIQSTIVNKRLRPVVRTFYRRTAFQLPNDSSVRISLDTNLTMIRECDDASFITNALPVRQWKRPDVRCDWPFLALAEGDVTRFPHAVLEVKTQGLDEQRPSWLEEILAGSLTEHVHKFSKYMHGCAMLYPSISPIPYWLPQTRVSIEKDPFHRRQAVGELVRGRCIMVVGESEPTTSDGLSPVIDHGKKIAMPVRIEPKVHLANERTFLKWVKFAVFLGAVGCTLITIGDGIARLCGLVLAIVAVLFAYYSFHLFTWRRARIYEHNLQPYDDLFGPSMLIVVYVVAMLIIIVFNLWNV